MAARPTPKRSLPSRSSEQNLRAAFAEVSTTQSNSLTRLTASRRAKPLSTGSWISMVGTSITSAPISRSCLLSSPACSVDRVTTTCWPNNGRFVNQFKSCAATSPTTIVQGACRGSWCSSASVERITLWSERVPHRTAAAGVFAARPPAMSRCEICCR